MKRHDRSLSLSWLMMILVVVAGLSLQGCMQKGAVSIVCGNTGATTPNSIPDEAGCSPTDGGGHAALGYKGINGPNPVPNHTPPYTCAVGSVIAANPGMSGCNSRNLSLRCTNTFTYPSSGTVGTCAWGCM